MNPQQTSILNRAKYRGQLSIEMATFAAHSLLFTKLVFFNHYPKLNIPIKVLLCYLYTATVDPLMVGTGYYFTRWYEHQ